MQKRYKILAGVLAGTLALGACPFALAVSYNDIGIAIMQGLSGSFGIVLAVPVTVALAVLLYTWSHPAENR